MNEAAKFAFERAISVLILAVKVLMLFVFVSLVLSFATWSIGI